MPRYAAVEAGGTSFSVAISEDPDTTKIVESANFPTTSPQETLDKVVAWLKERKFDSLGVASFGPVDLDEESPHYGYITTTPKPNWGFTPLLKAFDCFDVPKGFDTDVNAPALSEAHVGGHGVNGKSVSSCAYITVGTGVGVGVVVGGVPVHGLVHPEAGHLLVPRRADDLVSGFKGTCPFHGDCIEGLVATGALSARLSLPASELPNLPDSHALWEITGHYLAALCANLIYTVSPSVIVIGGGVLNRDCLYDIIRKKTLELLNGYIVSPKLTPEGISKYIVRSKFGNSSGLVGALELSRVTYHKKNTKL